ncbi:META domain-containing protein [Hymenobacter sp. BRD67]|uniref:META domain-containing protein n=1 Tax=Hymenobacter sp. BRD67 TaxID=2675877 RepID=UPI001563131D|nr:META domain-containing protein [Hymenobacter sp. BRD67]QKG53104.1 META domain-containing protein [Hymenobacter sp. BRD67]
MRRFAFLLPCLILVGTACQRVTDRANTTPMVSAITTPDAPLRETRWTVFAMGGQPLAPAASPDQVPYLLISNAGTAEGMSGCNRFRGGLKPAETDGQLQFANLGSTRMACPLMDTEHKFTQALDATRYYHISGDTLRLYTSAERTGTPLVQLVAAKMP